MVVVVVVVVAVRVSPPKETAGESAEFVILSQVVMIPSNDAEASCVPAMPGDGNEDNEDSDDNASLPPLSFPFPFS